MGARLKRQLSYGGWWVSCLLETMRSVCPDVELFVIAAHSAAKRREEFVEAGVNYIILPANGQIADWLGRHIPGIGALGEFTKEAEALRRLSVEAARVRPDIIQAFGSERAYGLIGQHTTAPVVLWIQGVLDVYKLHFFGSMGLRERMCSPRSLYYWWLMCKRAKRERKVFGQIHYFMGRTAWDRAHQLRLNPSGVYFQVDEAFRAVFWAAGPWQRSNCRPHTIYTTTSSALLKGTDVLIRAAALLLRDFPDIKIRIAGVSETSGFVARRLARTVSACGLKNHTKFLGLLTAEGIVAELQACSVFVVPSYIENSPNSLVEAQLVGVPSVASATGGILSMVDDGLTGLLFPAGDFAMLAAQIGRVFSDAILADRLGGVSREEARRRYQAAAVARSMRAAYDQICKTEHVRVRTLRG